MTYAITGIKEGLGPGDQVPLRREIDEWWFSKDENDLNQRSLFLYALHELMALDPEKEKLKSYFAIAGIHGQPLQPWDSPNAKGDWYCAHDTTLFGTWHRPYLALYEQRLYETMLDLIPRKFANEDQDAMIHAAKTWRLPYWDWAVKKPDWDPTNPDNPKNREPLVDLNVPYILTQETVSVRGKMGTVDSMPNPMWKFVLPQGRTFRDYGVTERNFPVCKATSRYPKSDGNDPSQLLYEEWVNGTTQDWAKIAGNLQSYKELTKEPTKDGGMYSNTLPENVYRLFAETNSKLPSYRQYVTQGWRAGDPPNIYASLEAVHGNLHGFIGGEGFMADVAVAAFDPIFWMHHCNIDRLLAMWQDLYRDKFNSWLNNPPPKPTDDNPLPETELPPFHKDANGTLYKSVDCAKQGKQLGYTYPELQFWLDKYKTNGVFDEQKYKNMLKADIDIKYSTSGKAALALKENSELATVHLSNMTAKNIAIENFPPQVAEKFEAVKAEHPQPIEPLQQETWTQNDYVFNAVYDKFALGGHPYSIRVFLGEFSLDGSLLFTNTPTQLGLVYNFSGPTEARGVGPEGCEHCKVQKAEHALSAGQVVLTDYLIEHITKQKTLRGIPLRSLDPDQVIPYLKENLHWRVTDFNNVEIPREDPRLQELKVSVAMGKATHFGPASHLSIYQDYEVLWDITENRPAGAAPGELGL